MNLKNKANEYAATLGHDFDRIPKTVLAAIAVSAVTCGGDYLNDAHRRIMSEWWTLHRNGIVPQKPFGPELEPTI